MTSDAALYGVADHWWRTAILPEKPPFSRRRGPVGDPTGTGSGGVLAR
jgi:hypothetical protein